ncbi:hypothetical protein LXL04_000870 [Taraxacum kok-saghyz]
MHKSLNNDDGLFRFPQNQVTNFTCEFNLDILIHHRYGASAWHHRQRTCFSFPLSKSLSCRRITPMPQQQLFSIPSFTVTAMTIVPLRHHTSVLSSSMLEVHIRLLINNESTTLEFHPGLSRKKAPLIDSQRPLIHRLTSLLSHLKDD